MWTDGRTDTRKLIDAYREYVNVLSNAVSIKRSMDWKKNQNKIGQTASSLATNTMFIPGRFKSLETEVRKGEHNLSHGRSFPLRTAKNPLKGN